MTFLKTGASEPQEEVLSEEFTGEELARLRSVVKLASQSDREGAVSSRCVNLDLAEDGYSFYAHATLEGLFERGMLWKLRHSINAPSTGKLGNTYSCYTPTEKGLRIEKESRK